MPHERRKRKKSFKRRLKETLTGRIWGVNITMILIIIVVGILTGLSLLYYLSQESAP
jgi:hypothetical protein